MTWIPSELSRGRVQGALDLRGAWLRIRWPLSALLAATLILGIILRFDDSSSSKLPIVHSEVESADEVHQGFLPDGRIDLNSASFELLMTLPGVGPATAQQIIEARSERPFSSFDEVDDCCADASQASLLESFAGVP